METKSKPEAAYPERSATGWKNFSIRQFGNVTTVRRISDLERNQSLHAVFQEILMQKRVVSELEVVSGQKINPQDFARF